MLDYTKDLSLFLNTKDRPNFLNLCLKYYSAIGFKGKIILCDASSDKNIRVNKLLINDLESLDIKHNIIMFYSTKE